MLYFSYADSIVMTGERTAKRGGEEASLENFAMELDQFLVDLKEDLLRTARQR